MDRPLRLMDRPGSLLLLVALVCTLGCSDRQEHARKGPSSGGSSPPAQARHSARPDQPGRTSSRGGVVPVNYVFAPPPVPEAAEDGSNDRDRYMSSAAGTVRLAPSRDEPRRLPPSIRRLPSIDERLPTVPTDGGSNNGGSTDGESADQGETSVGQRDEAMGVSTGLHRVPPVPTDSDRSVTRESDRASRQPVRLPPVPKRHPKVVANQRQPAPRRLPATDQIGTVTPETSKTSKTRKKPLLPSASPATTPEEPLHGPVDADVDADHRRAVLLPPMGSTPDSLEAQGSPNSDNRARPVAPSRRAAHPESPTATERDVTRPAVLDSGQDSGQEVASGTDRRAPASDRVSPFRLPPVSDRPEPNHVRRLPSVTGLHASRQASDGADAATPTGAARGPAWAVPPASNLQRPGNLVRPARESRLSPTAARVVQLRVKAMMDRAEALAGRGAFYAARDEMIKALRLITQTLDTHSGRNGHSRALARALRAFDEAEEFAPGGADLEADLNLTSLVTRHRTEVLKDVSLEGMTPMSAQQQYLAYAQRQFVEAVGPLPISSHALYALARIYTAMDSGQMETQKLNLPKAVTLHQAALLVDPRNPLSANELGVLLARFGRLADARDVLIKAVNVRPAPETWHNLAVVHHQLGDESLAQRASHESERRKEAGDGVAAGSAIDQVRWVDPHTFATALPVVDP